MGDFETTDFARTLPPISHVYMATSVGNALMKYFNDNVEDNVCIVLGQWEMREGKPGRNYKRGNKEEMGQGSSTVNFSSGVVTRRQSSPKGKEASCRTTSLNFTSGSCGVFAVHVVGICSVGGCTELLSGGELQIIGSVNRGSEANWRNPVITAELGRDSCSPVMLNFLWSEQDSKNLAVDRMSWRGQYFYPGPNRIILLYYDPEEFQRWKIPEDYPLGLPQVVLNGLVSIQNGDDEDPLPNFYSAFPKVPPDHQDLLACSKMPSSSIIATNPVVKFISTRSSGLHQILHKISILFGALFRKYSLMPLLNFLFLLMVDSLVGYLVTRYLLQLPDMMGLLHTTVDQMLQKLNHLLKWLRGAPAGLKLNPNLNSLYWRFFSYHIHLWANYIGILEPIFAVILYTIQYFGVLGATIQISLLKDLLSLATFHVYCLYIYATRLYSLQTTAIKALCRVFFGRKYNPLRNRIDSVQLTTPELFLSSFGFVILIFLFPTTFVYYTGFVFLRVPVLLIERLLQYLVITYNKLPVISWLLVFLKSPRVADEIYLVPLTPLTSPSPPFTSNVQAYQKRNSVISFRICLQSTRTLFSPPNFSGGIKSIVGCVIDGTVLKD